MTDATDTDDGGFGADPRFTQPPLRRAPGDTALRRVYVEGMTAPPMSIVGTGPGVQKLVQEAFAALDRIEKVEAERDALRAALIMIRRIIAPRNSFNVEGVRNICDKAIGESDV